MSALRNPLLKNERWIKVMWQVTDSGFVSSLRRDRTEHSQSARVFCLPAFDGAAFVDCWYIGAISPIRLQWRSLQIKSAILNSFHHPEQLLSKFIRLIDYHLHLSIHRSIHLIIRSAHTRQYHFLFLITHRIVCLNYCKIQTKFHTGECV